MQKIFVTLEATYVDRMTSVRVMEALQSEICRLKHLKPEDFTIYRFDVLSEDERGTDFEVEYRMSNDEQARLLSDNEWRTLYKLATFLTALVRMGLTGP